MSLDIRFDAQDALKKIKLTAVEMRRISRRLMMRSLAEARKDVRREYRGGTLKRGTGDLARSVQIKADNSFGGSLRVTAAYASFHETGVTIRPKEKNYLTFQVNGNWVRKSEVTIPARPVAHPVMRAHYSHGGKAEKTMDNVFQQELDKIFNKRE